MSAGLPKHPHTPHPIRDLAYLCRIIFSFKRTLQNCHTLFGCCAVNYGSQEHVNNKAVTTSDLCSSTTAEGIQDLRPPKFSVFFVDNFRLSAYSHTWRIDFSGCCPKGKKAVTK